MNVLQISRGILASTKKFLVLPLSFIQVGSILAQHLPVQSRLDSPQRLQASPQTRSAKQNVGVIVLGYHRFGSYPKDTLAIQPEVFREQMQFLKDNGIAVISMKDFLSWRRGEKGIPLRSALITIDDGYMSSYDVAWPILREFGYPVTLYLYTKYVNVGGKSLSWKQLQEMRDSGMEFGSHSVSHTNMLHPRTLGGYDYQSWLSNELGESKRILECHLGVPVATFAYPYGSHDINIVQAGLRNGYEAMFTVNPVPVHLSSPSGSLGRFIIYSTQPGTFRNAIRTFGGKQGTEAVPPGAYHWTHKWGNSGGMPSASRAINPTSLILPPQLLTLPCRRRRS
jgi:peptidoglycan/xylan/chitin deacetylase (PgdA/CDA1 family)